MDMVIVPRLRKLVAEAKRVAVIIQGGKRMVHRFGKRAAVAFITGALAVGMAALFSGTALAGGHHGYHDNDGGNGGGGGDANANCVLPIGVALGVIGQGGGNAQCNAVGGGGGEGGDGVD
ncbi:hypothetical protein GCM10023321_24330 [Pseudonocardia eucalypti]|uniref:DUF320 domain-containing protein n=2 Tax=Pseudonocardia eucalypti TaxID=648755 RepID=A0ABP9PX48_9PSEU